MNRVQYFNADDQINLINLVDVEIATSSVEIDIDERVSMATDSIQAQMLSGKTIACSFSAGKDSSVCVALVLSAARLLRERGLDVPPVLILHGDTLIENPEVSRLAKSEMAKMKMYADKHDFELIVKVATPSLSEHYFVQILAGRTIANMPDGGSKCADMMKVGPITRLKRNISKEYGLENVITIVGTRLDESATRERAMTSRGESALVPALNKQGEYILSPIMDWPVDSVFEFIGYVKVDIYEAYSDFVDLLEFYRGLNNGSCELAIYSGGNGPKRKACGSRSGCSLCLRSDPFSETREESLAVMVQQPQYAYMKGLTQLRDFIAKTHYDPARRNWLARKLNSDGTLNISPNSYSIDHCNELLRYALTIDVEEKEAAEELGIEPRFELLRPQDIVAIDFIQARYAYTSKLNACYWYRQIYFSGERFHVPADTPIYPKERFADPVAINFKDEEYDHCMNGQRDIEAAMAGVEDITVKSNGLMYSGGEGGESFRVDPEGAELFLDFELDWAIEKYFTKTVSPTSIVHYFLGLGTVELYKGQHSSNDRQLKMANQIHRHGIQNILNDREALLRFFGAKDRPEVPSEEQHSLLFDFT